MSIRIITGDCREKLAELPDESVHCVVTSPPYWGLRDYGVAGQIGLEELPGSYVNEMVYVFRQVRRVLRSDGTLWLNLGDSYSGSGKGGNPEEGKQATNRGSQSIGVLYGKTGESARQAAVTNVTRDVSGLNPKNLVGIPWRVAFALQADGWYLRQDIIWSKPNPMPESVRDRCTKAHEYIFLLSKSERYYYDADAIKESGSENSHGSPNVNPGEKNGTVRKDAGSLGQWPPRAVGAKDENGAARPPTSRPHSLSAFEEASGREYPLRNKRSVWEVSTNPFPEAHFATFPPALIEPCILAGCPKGETVLDPFGGAGTTGLVADGLGRNAILIELNPAYAAIAEKRIDLPMFACVTK